MREAAEVELLNELIGETTRTEPDAHQLLDANGASKWLRPARDELPATRRFIGCLNGGFG